MKDGRRTADEEEWEEEPGGTYLKNKNLTQRCGEKKGKSLIYNYLFKFGTYRKSHSETMGNSPTNLDGKIMRTSSRNGSENDPLDFLLDALRVNDPSPYPSME